MTLATPERSVTLTIPAQADCALVARMALSGLGLLAGLDVDIIGDLRTVTDECCDCLEHQPYRPARIRVEAWAGAGRFRCRFTAEERGAAEGVHALDLEITRGVLETLMPVVRLESDEGGVYGIECSVQS